MAMGHNPNTLTSANTVLSLICEGLYEDWITLKGAQTDAFLSFGDVTLAQTEQGVDGLLSIGWKPSKTTATISLMANSESVMVFENIANFFNNRQEVSKIKLRAYYPSVKRTQVLSGTLVTKSGGTGVATMLNGHTYILEGISEGVQEVN